MKTYTYKEIINDSIRSLKNKFKFEQEFYLKEDVDEIKLSPEEKVKKARKLLHEATCELRKKRQLLDGNKLCKCGHKRKHHSISHSINYTGGVCSKCDCMNFIEAN